ncbi:DNA-binding protein [Rhizobium lentis]|uniref:DNA-binding protein n=2 Tax=Rhizobium TaxID=379 RepID=A0A7W8UNP8_9HYPH|nr:DNA-binding protein [Rhizobium lentis]MEB3047387.1 DNA-binding protein [Rhizobium sp. MJ21]MBB4574575.1 hypothetical protein [Rhizobium lentis]MBB5550502.1 hypothetical protein [Rhizobium lentis]MBB5561376.1 hypothetical protein [Rhizobium lentis]MBB5567621.1 hypothetical protein [Rhizobium lentis]
MKIGKYFSYCSYERLALYTWSEVSVMTSRVLQFTELSDRDRKAVAPMPKLAEGDHLELRIRGEGGQLQTLSLPASALAPVEALLDHLLRGERVAVLTEDQELSPTDASTILGISRPLVVLRMDRGDLPFRYVGKHRRAKLKDVLALKAKLDIRQKSLNALAEDTEDLIVNHGL